MQVIVSNNPSKLFTTAWGNNNSQILNENHKQLPRFIFDQELKNEKTIFIVSTEPFIQEALKLIRAYTTLIDPSIKLKDVKVSQINITENFPNFNFCADIQPLLPNVIQKFYGFNNRANCYGSALVAGGIIPLLLCFNSPPFSFFSNFMEKVSIEDIQLGDIVSLQSDQDDKKHAFVFLSPLLCISMNGRHESLELYETSLVLKEYGFSENALKEKENSKIFIFRKKNLVQFDSVLQDILNYVDDYNRTNFDLKSIETKKNRDSLEKLINFNFSIQMNSSIDKSTKELVQYVSNTVFEEIDLTSRQINFDKFLKEMSMLRMEKSKRKLINFESSHSLYSKHSKNIVFVSFIAAAAAAIAFVLFNSFLREIKN